MKFSSYLPLESPLIDKGQQNELVEPKTSILLESQFLVLMIKNKQSSKHLWKPDGMKKFDDIGKLFFFYWTQVHIYCADHFR